MVLFKLDLQPINMFRVPRYYISMLQLCAMSLAFAPEINDSQINEPESKNSPRGANPISTNLTSDSITKAEVDISYTIQLQQDVPKGQNGTHCIGLIIDSKSIVTSQACNVTKSAADDGSYAIADIVVGPLRLPLATQTLKLDPPMTLGPNYVLPSLIASKERYAELKNEDRFGIVISSKGPEMGLVRWLDQMTSKNEGKNDSVCEESYSVLRQKNPGWPDFLPEGIFCIRGSRPNEDNYVAVVKGENVTIGAGLPCGDSIGSPIIIPNEGVLGVVTAAYCESNPQVTYTQSLAYINITQDDQRNRTSNGTEMTSTPASIVGTPTAFYPIPSQYLAPPLIKVIEPTSSANHVWNFKVTWNTGILTYYGVMYQRSIKLIKN